MAFRTFEFGARLPALAKEFDFAFFEYWASDYAGHHQDMDSAVQQLEIFDQVLKGLLANWDDHAGLILLTSDHGNMENLSTRKHTDAKAPLLLFGENNLRKEFQKDMVDIADITPAITRLLELNLFRRGARSPIA